MISSLVKKPICILEDRRGRMRGFKKSVADPLQGPLSNYSMCFNMNWCACKPGSCKL